MYVDVCVRVRQGGWGEGGSFACVCVRVCVCVCVWRKGKRGMCKRAHTNSLSPDIPCSLEKEFVNFIPFTTNLNDDDQE